MIMSSRERLLIALNNGRPDRLPCQVHGWMEYYLDHYLHTKDWIEANERFGFDQALYISPSYIISDRDLDHWRLEKNDLGIHTDGYYHWDEKITTPDGCLTVHKAANDFTVWIISTRRNTTGKSNVCSGKHIFVSLMLKPVISITLTEGWIVNSCWNWPLANSFIRVQMLFFKVLRVRGNHIWLARWAGKPANKAYKQVTSAFRIFSC